MVIPILPPIPISAPGKPTVFQLKAANNHGLWNEESIEIQIYIRPPWWNTIIFKITLALLIIGLVYLVYRMRLNLILKQQEILENKVEKRTKELSLANEVILGHKEEIENQNRDLRKAFEQLKDTQAKLVQSEKMASLGILTAGIAHEINNPINFIKGSVIAMKRALPTFFEIIQLINAADDTDSDEKLTLIRGQIKERNLEEFIQKMSKLTDHIEIGVNRTTDIVKGLNSFSRSDSSDFVAANLNDCVKDTLILLTHLTKNKVTVSQDLQPIPEIYCSPGQINQVLMNLLVNAVDAIEGEGQIHIATWQNNNQVHLMIRDSGQGIDQENLAKIFDPFFTTKEVGKGTGLGLSITMGIIKDHQGEIKIDSEPGVGTTVKVIFPINSFTPEK